MAVMKTCFKCGIEKSLNEFYKHSEMADGHLGKCKNCTKNDTKTRTAILYSDPTFVEKERSRNREKYYRLGYREIYKPSYEQKKESIDRWANRYPEKVIANYKTQKMPRKQGYHLHHWSYLPEHRKDVIELSIQDHYTAHRFLIYDQERMQYRCLNGILLDTRQAHEEYIAKHIDSI